MVDPRIFICLARVEKETYDLYIKISNKTMDTYISLMLKFIGYDTFKHSLIFTELAKMHGLEKEEVSNDVCINVLGTFYRDSRMLLNNLSEFVEKKQTLSGKELRSILEKLIPYEDNLSEEYFVGLVTLIFSRSIEEPSKAIKNLLNLIHEDEERHGNLLKKVVGKIPE